MIPVRRKTATVAIVGLAAVALVAWWIAGSPGAGPKGTSGGEGKAAGKEPTLAPAPLRPRPIEEAPAAGPSVEPGREAPAAVAKGGTIEGTVFGDDGKPLPGVAVFVCGPEEPLPPRTGRHSWEMTEDEEVVRSRRGILKTSAREDGRYVVTGVALGAPRVVVARVSPTLEGRSDPVTLARDGETARRDVRVPRPAALHIVIDGLPGDAVPQVDVEGDLVWLTLEEEARRKDGSWSLDGLLPGPYVVRVFPDGRPPVSVSVDAVAGATTEVDVRVPAGLVVEGTVVTSEGHSVALASVTWEGRETVLTAADEKGRFRIEGLSPGPGRLSVDGLQFAVDALAKAVIENLVPGGEPLRVVLPDSPVVVFRLVEFQAKPTVESVVVTRDLTNWGEVRSQGTQVVALTRVGMPALVVLWPEGFAPLVVEVPPLTAGQRHDAGTLRPQKGRTLVVRVSDPQGKPVPGTLVTLAERWEGRRETTDAEGVARFANMAARPVQVAVDAPGFPRHVVTLAPPTDAPQAVLLGHGGVLDVTVRDAEGRPAPDARVVVFPAGDHPYEADFDWTRLHAPDEGEGRLRMRLSARDWRVRASVGNGNRTGEATATVVEGGTTPVEVRLR